MRRTLTLLATSAAAIIVLAAAVPAFAAPKGPVVSTANGPVRGLDTGAMHEFLGIPYAAPPVGALRWHAPEPAAPWTGVRDATRFAPHCPQTASILGTSSTNENCLYLNVFTPKKTNEGVPHLLPVMVWIYGGGFTEGESDFYDPSRLVAQGVVVVTFNYRLGELGFLAHPALGKGDYGLMDQQAALRWVQANIRRFGGDPGNVTIFGESAGGVSVNAQLVSPGAKGLFEKAIAESGDYSLVQPSTTAADAAGEQFAKAVGCSDPTTAAACLRSKSVAQILAAQPPGLTTLLGPNVDGNVLPMSIGTAFATGAFTHVPVIEGSNHDEWRFFVAETEAATGTPLNTTTYVPAVEATLAPFGFPQTVADALAALYLAEYSNPSIALGALGTDGIFACETNAAVGFLSQWVPTYQYEFADESAPWPLFPVSFSTGAYHGSELQYLNLFGPDPLLTASQQQLSTAMVDAWTQFAKAGVPDAWPRYDATQQFESLVPPSPMPMPATDFATDHNCAIWQALLAG